MKSIFNKTKKDISTETIDHSHTIKAHKIGDTTLTITTVIFVIISLSFKMQFAPFIVLLMSSRIGTSIYTVIKNTSKREIRKLILWSALFIKSAISCFQFFTLKA